MVTPLTYGEVVTIGSVLCIKYSVGSSRSIPPWRKAEGFSVFTDKLEVSKFILGCDKKQALILCLWMLLRIANGVSQFRPIMRMDIVRYLRVTPWHDGVSCTAALAGNQTQSACLALYDWAAGALWLSRGRKGLNCKGCDDAASIPFVTTFYITCLNWIFFSPTG